VCARMCVRVCVYVFVCVCAGLTESRALRVQTKHQKQWMCCTRIVVFAYCGRDWVTTTATIHVCVCVCV